VCVWVEGGGFGWIRKRGKALEVYHKVGEELHKWTGKWMYKLHS